jgi:uncharacterized Zn finger protein (UPF0148 family)
MAQCRNCSEVFADGLKFCTRCGTPATGTDSTVACASCGATIAQGKRFCTTCGTPVGVTTPVTNQQAVPMPPPHSRPPVTPTMPPPSARPPMPTQTAHSVTRRTRRDGWPTTRLRPATSKQRLSSSSATTAQCGQLWRNSSAAAAQTARKSNSTVLVAVLLLGIFVALTAGGYLAYRHLTTVPATEQQASTVGSTESTSPDALGVTGGNSDSNGKSVCTQSGRCRFFKANPQRHALWPPLRNASQCWECAHGDDIDFAARRRSGNSHAARLGTTVWWRCERCRHQR